MRLDYELAATVLAEATLEDDRTVCERHGITPRTLRNYRYRLQSDPELSLLFRERLRTLEREWANELAPAPTVWGYTPSGPARSGGLSRCPHPSNNDAKCRNLSPLKKAGHRDAGLVTGLSPPSPCSWLARAGFYRRIPPNSAE